MIELKIHHSILPPQYPSDRMHPTTLKNIKKWDVMNPDIKFDRQIWTDAECKTFLGDNFGSDVLKFYVAQPDGRFKSDLWRLCVLYVHGGIYADIDIEPLKDITDYVDFENIDFCGCTNMERFNVTNCFIYAKKNSQIIKQNIDETVKRYRNTPQSNYRNINIIGGCFIMGSVIEQNQKNALMPLGEITIGDEKCLFLHERGDKELEKISKQTFWNSFGVYFGDVRIMNSRYETYHIDRNKRNEFVSRDD